MENKTGLKSEFLKELHAQILSFPGIEQVFIFGSRARGDYRKYSDVDLA
ncbi:nucleotidyltransferase domain-containing protein, partial [Streptococcus danieliae]|nr:nucleotidyltransferase domain-containing protein [Streptococcus danieliae]